MHLMWRIMSTLFFNRLSKVFAEGLTQDKRHERSPLFACCKALGYSNGYGCAITDRMFGSLLIPYAHLFLRL